MWVGYEFMDAQNFCITILAHITHMGFSKKLSMPLHAQITFAYKSF
jgi:hypothetical protein